jgi:hypothetical protein
LQEGVDAVGYLVKAWFTGEGRHTDTIAVGARASLERKYSEVL